MFCTKCGSQVTEGLSYCPKCGALLKSQADPHQPSNGITPISGQAPQASGQASQSTGQAPQSSGQTPTYQNMTSGQMPGYVPVQGAKSSGPNVALFLIPGLLIGFLLAGGIFLSLRSGSPSPKGNGTVLTQEKQDKKDRNNKETEGSETEDVSAVGTKATRTLMIYIVGSDLESRSGRYGGAATKDITEILAADLPDDVNVVLECGGSEKWDNRNIPDGEVTRFCVRNGKLKELDRLGAVSMSRPGDLTDFITFAAENFPASNYTLILWDHGGGIPVGFGYDELADYESMYDYQIGQELENSGIHFDAVIFDACNMCTLEMGKALKPSADYMVGAESYVNNAGIYYTNWLSRLNENARDFCEVIVQDYMDTIQADGLVGSMSVIRLDYIDEVYDAYVDYVSSLTSSLEEGDYAGYYQARGNCGYYEENDSVDLITLATSYQTSASTPLINSVVNSVIYTESDIAYGHGLMAYSPYEWYDMYTDGRVSFEQLDYDPAVTDFYDRFISMQLAYLGEDYVDYYAGDWYLDDYEAEVAEEAGTYALDVTDAGPYYAVDLDDEDWDLIDTISQTLVIEFDDSYLLLGEDYTYQVDSKGQLAMVDPQAWIYINDQLAPYYCLSYYTDPEGTGWAQTGIVPSRINDHDAYLVIYYDENYPTGMVQGYYLCDFTTGEEESTTYMLEEEDMVDLLYQYLDDDGNVTYEPAGNPASGTALVLDYATIDLDEYTTYGYYTIHDVYGNVYETDVYALGSINSLQ